MKIEIKVPSAGESVTEATVAAILKESGAHVNKDDEVLELETDKVNQVIYAPESGQLTLTVAVDDTVTIGQVLGTVDTDAKGAEAPPPAKEEPKKEEPKKQEAAPPPPVTDGRPIRISRDEHLKQEKAKPEPKKEKVEAKEGQTRKRMSGLRRTIAARLVEVKNQTAMLTTFNEVDMTNIMERGL